MPATRIVLIGQLSAAIMPAPVLFYLLACAAPPYHLARAIVVTFAYLAVFVGAGLLIYRVQLRRAWSSGLARAYSRAGAGDAALSDRVPRAVTRGTRAAMVVCCVVAGLVLLSGFSHAVILRECTTPVPGWPQASATVTRVYLGWNGGSRTYTAVGRFTAAGRAVYFTAPVTADAVRAGDQILVTYQPGNPFQLHDLSAGQALWKDPLYTSLIALAVLLTALVAGLTLTDQKRLRRTG